MLNFKTRKSFLKKNSSFLLFAFVFFILIFTVENINGRFWLNDFKVYYLAAKSLLEGKQVYGIPFGLDTGYYKYSPFVMMIFSPYCLFSYKAASIIHFFVIVIFSILAILVIQKIVNRYLFNSENKNKNLLLSISVFCILRHIVRELHLGNVNMILVFLLCLGLLLTLKGRYVFSGICIGAAIIVKPYFILLMLPLLLNKKNKTIYSAINTVVLSVFIAILILGFSKGILLHQEWIHSMIKHNSYITSNETFQSLIKYYFYKNLPGSFQFYILAIALIAYVIFYFYTIKIESKSPEKENNSVINFIIFYFVLIAIIPNLLLTDTEHFLYSLPLVILLLNYLWLTKNIYEISAFVVLIFFYALNSSDILGHKLSDKFDEMGLLGISNLLLIAFSLYITFKKIIPTRNENAKI